MPLRAIADGSIGEKLCVEVQSRAEVMPMLRAISMNRKLKFFEVLNASDATILEVRPAQAIVRYLSGLN